MFPLPLHLHLDTRSCLPRRRPSVAPVAMTPTRGGSQPPSQDCTSSQLTLVYLQTIFTYKLFRMMLPCSQALITLDQAFTPVSACRRSQTSRLDNRCGSSVWAGARVTTFIVILIDGCSSVVLWYRKHNLSDITHTRVAVFEAVRTILMIIHKELYRF